MHAVKQVVEFVMDILETVVFVGSIFIVTYLFIAQPNQVKGESMVPTFQNGDYIFTNKITYKFRSPQRGDVVVFRAPKNPDIEYIKRIIGIPGDTIVINNGIVSVNGTPLNETWTSASTDVWEGGYAKENVPITVPKGDIWVMGDNRPRSSDSREFGPVPIDTVIGQVFYRYFPADKLGTINNPLPVSLHTMENHSNESFFALKPSIK